MHRAIGAITEYWDDDMKTDTTEKGLESLIVQSLVNEAGYVQGDPRDYDREHAVDLAKLLQFLASTQPDGYEALGIDKEGPKRTHFCTACKAN